MSSPKPGIAIPKVEFYEGEPLSPDLPAGKNNPQNIWFSLENAQRWAAERILGLSTINPYSEAAFTANDELVRSDALRESGNRYTDRRGLNALGVFFGVQQKSKLANEFYGKSVVDIGSGAGILANDIRKRAHAPVTEIDFSEKAQKTAEPIFKGLGARILADACDMAEIEDASFDASISMYSTTVHTETIYRRLKSFTETLRVTRAGGRAFFVPYLGGMIMRHNRWESLGQLLAEGKFKRDDELLTDEIKSMRQSAAMEYSLIGLTKTLILIGAIDFRPHLVIDNRSGEEKEAVSAICDVKKTISSEDAEMLIAPYLRLFSATIN